ncbi:MAG: DUF4321 domain-containing protein [Chitinispirillaceae bacterium]|jgi:hypothetical protein|nr:DUF4321 domain-containing protein [Chitinispirillaceae bacterium]
MAGLLKERSTGALIVALIVGLVIGAYLNTLVQLLPGGTNVVKTFFTFSFPIGIGDFTSNKPVLIDLVALKLQLGFQLKISLMSIIGLIVSMYLFRWYR